MLAAAADLLDQGQIVNRLSLALTAIALGVLLLPMLPVSEISVPSTVVVGIVGMVELFASMRVNLDATLFRRLSVDAAEGRLDVPALDAALVALNLMTESEAGQPVVRRFATARRYFRVQQAALLVQVVATIAGALAIYLDLA